LLSTLFRTLLRLKTTAALLAFAAISASLSLHAQAALEQQLIAADRAIFEVTTGAHADVEKYEQMLAPDYIDIEYGRIYSREEDVRQVKGMRDFEIEYKNPRAVVLSPTAGYVLAEVSYTGVVNGAGIKNHVLSTTIYSLEQGKWLAHLQMMEPVTAAPKSTAAVPENDPTLVALRALATQVEAQVRVPGYGTFAPPKVMLDAGMGGSYFTYGDTTVHSSQFADLPAPMQDIWNQWAAYTTDQPTGKALFDDMFHRFFFVHELGHWMASQVIAGLPENQMSTVAKNEAGHMWEREVAANRIAVAWYREHDPQYLAKLVKDFRSIQAHLPDPVPAGVDKNAYFTDNYQKLGTDPMAYGWYQLQMVLIVYDEPVHSFQQVLDALPKNRYE
jgi:hypothetical protein